MIKHIISGNKATLASLNRQAPNCNRLDFENLDGIFENALHVYPLNTHNQTQNQMIRFIHFLCRKPVFFDVLIFILLPFYSHAITVFHRRESAWELMHMKGYWIALGFTWVCALIVTGYIKFNTVRFGKQYGIHDGVLKRLSKQWLWNFLPPLVFVLLAVAVYYVFNHTSIAQRGYFSNEFFFVIGGVFCLVLLYSSFDILCFVVSEGEERYAFEAFKAQVLSEQPTVEPSSVAPEQPEVAAIQVQHYFKNELHTLPVHRIGLIEYRKQKATCYTYDGRKYRLPTTKEDLRGFSKAHGFYWLSPFYGFALEGITHLVRGGDGPMLIALKPGIEPVPQIQVVPSGTEEEVQRYYIKIHKNKARKVHDRYTELMAKKGRPGSGRP